MGRLTLEQRLAALERRAGERAKDSRRTAGAFGGDEQEVFAAGQNPRGRKTASPLQPRQTASGPLMSGTTDLKIASIASVHEAVLFAANLIGISLVPGLSRENRLDP
jgi:hypothetical protein